MCILIYKMSEFPSTMDNRHKFEKNSRSYVHLKTSVELN